MSRDEKKLVAAPSAGSPRISVKFARMTNDTIFHGAACTADHWLVLQRVRKPLSKTPGSVWRAFVGY
jgi:hypothetical protein